MVHMVNGALDRRLRGNLSPLSPMQALSHHLGPRVHFYRTSAERPGCWRGVPMSLLTAASHSLQNCIAFQLLADPAAISRAQMACKVLNDEYADPIIWKSACLLQVGALLVDKSANPLICSNFIQTSTRSVGQCRCLMALDHLIYIRCSPIRSFAALASAGVESRLNLWVDPHQTVGWAHRGGFGL